MAGRLLRVIHHVVALDQTCGVPGRFIGENVAFLRDAVTFANEFNVPAAILLLHQGKAFDRVDCPFFFFCPGWVLVHLLSPGSNCCIPMCIALCSLMVIHPVPSSH